MTKPKKKTKTGDVVAWATILKDSGIVSGCWLSRSAARRYCNSNERIAKIVLAK